MSHLTNMPQTALYLDVRPTQQEEHHAWSRKPCPLPTASEVMDLGDNPTIITLLNHCISSCILSICP